MEELVSFGLEAWGKAYNPLESWINHFLGVFLMKWGHGVLLLVIYNLPPKFGLKRSTLKFLVFQVSGSGFRLFTYWSLNVSREKFSWICKFRKFNWNQFEELKKTQKSFRNQRRLIFPPNLLENWFFAKIEAKLKWNNDFKLR